MFSWHSFPFLDLHASLRHVVGASCPNAYPNLEILTLKSSTVDNYIKPRNGASETLLPGLLTNIATDLTTLKANLNKKDQATWDQWNNLHNSISTYYDQGGNGAGELDWSITWEWNSNNVKREEIENVLEKRHVAKRQACSQPTSHSGSIDPTTTEPSTTQPHSTSATATPTATVSGSPTSSSSVLPGSSGSSALPTSSLPLPSITTTRPVTTTVAPSTTVPMVTYPCSTVTRGAALYVSYYTLFPSL